MNRYRIVIEVKEIHGECPLYHIGDRIILDEFYINTKKSKDICMHAFSAISTILSAFAHGASARELGIGTEEDIGYLQCSDPGPPWTKGGTVLFKIKREMIRE